MSMIIRTKRIAILLVIVLTVLPFSVFADTASSVQYLLAQPQDSWTTMALVASGAGTGTLDHLATVSGTAATDYAKTILALTAVGKNPSTFGSTDYVGALENFSHNGQLGDPALLNDDIWGLLALSSVHKLDSSAAQAALATIIANQNSDGGWSYAVGGPSDSNDTAAALMALAEAGENAQSAAVSKALAYLHTVQNSDGGFGYQPGNESDSGSDAWVIIALRKLHIDPESWSMAQGTPLAHLQSLQDTDGGFWWVQVGTSDWNNKAMTSFAVIASAGKTIPLNYYQAEQQGTFAVRIEGANATVCTAVTAGPTALDVVKNAASGCGFTYTLTDTIYGPYLSEIAGESAAGLSGWMYVVNSQPPSVGAADYTLGDGDQVVWYYGQWDWQQTRLRASVTNPQPGDTVEIIAEFYNGAAWQKLPQARILINGDVHIADGNGVVPIIVSSTYMNAVINMPGYVRSEVLDIVVGGSTSTVVGLTVNIDQPGNVAGESIGIIVAPEIISFGTLVPGTTSTQAIVVKNIGSTPATLTASVLGDDIFSLLTINGYGVNAYQNSVAVDNQVVENIGLGVPSSYLGFGVKTGELTWWATPQ